MRSLLSIFLVLLSTTAYGQQQPICAPRQMMIDELHKQADVTTTWRGVSMANEMIELLKAEDGKWAIIATNAQGGSCIIATGLDSTNVEPANNDPES